MDDIDAALADTRKAVTEFVVVGGTCGTAWTVPRAPGKWSPSQIAEHVARALEESAKVADGRPSAFPNLPSPVQWLLKVFLFNRVLRGSRFPNGKTARSLNPPCGPATPAEARVRLEAAVNEFDRACRSRAVDSGLVNSPIVGVVSVVDFARFQELHVRHHEAQMQASAPG